MALNTNAENIIETCHLFKELTPESRKPLIESAEIKSYPKGTLIFQQGDSAIGIFIVVSGAVRLYKLAPSGKEHVLHLAEPGNTCAEVAVIGNFPCPANAEAIDHERLGGVERVDDVLPDRHREVRRQSLELASSIFISNGREALLAENRRSAIVKFFRQAILYRWSIWRPGGVVAPGGSVAAAAEGCLPPRHPRHC